MIAAVAGQGGREQMCSVAEVTLTKTPVQFGMFLTVTLWQSALPWIITVVVVLCRIKNSTHRNQRGAAMGRR